VKPLCYNLTSISRPPVKKDFVHEDVTVSISVGAYKRQRHLYAPCGAYELLPVTISTPSNFSGTAATKVNQQAF